MNNIKLNLPLVDSDDLVSLCENTIYLNSHSYQNSIR